MLNTSQPVAVTRGFLDGKPKLNLIDGRFEPAISGKTFATINPATG